MDSQQTPDITKPAIHTRLTSKDWIPTTVATIISIALTIGVTWYSIDRSEKQAILAMQERTKTAKDNLVSIIEEHIINHKIIDIDVMNKLINTRIKEDNIEGKIFVNELVEKAEYNILKSTYLDFNKKQEYKLLFDTIYQKLTPIDSLNFQHFKYGSLLNELASKIEQHQSKDAIDLMQKIAQSYEGDITKTKPPREISDILNEFTKNPVESLVLVIIYIFMIFVFTGKLIPSYAKIIRRLFSKDR